MIFALLKKDFRLAVSNPLHIGTITFVPILIILVLGFTMDNYMTKEYGTFDDAKVFYYEDNPSADIAEQFTEVSGMMTAQIGVEFERVADYDDARRRVEESEAYSVITLTQDGFDYYRSPFNEPNGGEIVRSLFVQLTETGSDADTTVQNVVLDVEAPNADVYYTFAGLAFAIMFVGVVMSNSYGRDFGSDTFTRITMSKAGLPAVVLSKLICGIVFGMMQIAIGIGVSTLVFGISWGDNFGYMLAVFMTLLMFSLCLGSMLGCLIKKQSVSYTVVGLCAMLSAYLGGSITPVYLLERLPVVRYVIKISPVYWTNQSLSTLYNGIIDAKTRTCIIVLLAVSAVFIAVTVLSASNTKIGGRMSEQAEEAA